MVGFCCSFWTGFCCVIVFCCCKVADVSTQAHTQSVSLTSLHTAIGSLLVQLTGEKTLFPSSLQIRGEIVFIFVHTSVALAILTAWRSHGRLDHPLPVHGRSTGSLTIVPYAREMLVGREISILTFLFDKNPLALLKTSSNGIRMDFSGVMFGFSSSAGKK